MTPVPQIFLQLTIKLTEALRQETMLARTGALAQLNRAAVAKQAAFHAFRDACVAREALASSAEAALEIEQEAEHDPEYEAELDADLEAEREAEQQALRNLLMAANESALVLEAVKGTLDDFLARLKAAVKSLADSGTYGPNTWRCRDVVAVRLDASA